MKKSVLIIIIILFTKFGQSQYFVPFGEDSLWRTNSTAVVNTIYVSDTNLYVGGFSLEYGRMTLLNQLGLWYNNDWHSIDNGLGDLFGQIYCIEKYNNNLYIGGNLNDIQGIPNTENIGRFNGTGWEAVPNSFGDVNSTVYDMVLYNNLLIIGGGFSGIGSIPLNFYYVAAYNDTDYINIGSMPSTCWALEVYNGELYYGGDWYTVKKYIGNQQWEDVGGYFNDYIYDMVVDTFNNFLYVCGGFSIVDDSISTDNVACWDGFKWSRVGYGTGESNLRKAMGMYRGYLYVNSNIDTIGGVYTGYLMKWDGTNWSQGIPGGIQFGARALEVFDDMLYIGGSGPIDGSLYSPMDTGRKTLARWQLPSMINCNTIQPRVQTYEDTFDLVNDTVQVQFYNNNAYVDSWSWDFGDGGTDTVKDPLHIYTDTGIYDVSVTVSHASCTKTATKTIVVQYPLKVNELKDKESGFKLYPNPTSNTLYIEITDKQLFGRELQIVDMNGKTLKTVIASEAKQSVDIKSLPKGVYFVKIGDKAERFVKE